MTTKRMVIHGAAGRMGLSVARVIAEDAGATLVGALEQAGSAAIGADIGELAGIGLLGVPVRSDAGAVLGASGGERPDVVIDFSLPAALPPLLAACRAASVPLVSGTTGLDEATEAARRELGGRVPAVFAPNFSQGVNAFFFLAKRAAELLGPGFDAEIVEVHHRHKVDAPSGTAERLFRVVAEGKGLQTHVPTYGRSGQVGERPDGEIGVFAMRGGDVVGEHTLYLFGDGERIELSHRATDRQIFARGAVRAAHWICGRAPGLYDMGDVMGIPR